MEATVTSASAQGLRESQEDRFVAERLADGWLLGVFDGHNGPAAADLASRLAGDAFRHALDRHHDARAALESTIGVLRTETADHIDGSSVSLAHVDEGRRSVLIAVLGDSPVLVRNADGHTILGPLHNTMLNEQDAARAVERGAMLVGPYLVNRETLSGVNLTRTIGDADLAFLGREPEIVDAALGDFVCLASDGVFSFAAPEPQALVDRLTFMIDEGADAQAIVDDALVNASDDNVTVVLWRAGS